MSVQLIQQYHSKVEKIIRYGGSRNESALRKPFQDLLEAYGFLSFEHALVRFASRIDIE